MVALLGCVSVSHAEAAASPAPREWIEPATGHRVIRLSSEAGTRSMYFHQNSITPDGRFVAFMSSQATVPGQATNIFVRDMQTGQTNLVSTNVATLIGTADYRCSSAVLSADGRYVAFIAAQLAAPGQYVLRHDLQTTTTVVISSAATNLSHGIQISADGRYVLFEEFDTVYSKVMLWVAFDRGLRLAEKRNLPCPNRKVWLETRDNLYEEIMQKGKFYHLSKRLRKLLAKRRLPRPSDYGVWYWPKEGS
jgi:hypothetical protein